MVVSLCSKLTFPSRWADAAASTCLDVPFPPASSPPGRSRGAVGAVRIALWTVQVTGNSCQLMTDKKHKESDITKVDEILESSFPHNHRSHISRS